MKIYCIYDNNARTYGTPFFQPTNVHAVRAMKVEINRQDPGNVMYLFPGEYDLYLVGEFNDQDGKVSGLETPEKLANGSQLKIEVK